MTDAGGRPYGPPGGTDDDAHVTEQLQALPRTVAMPRDVSIRIAAAIEAESDSARARGTLDVPAAGDVPADESAGEPSPAAAPRGWFRRRFGHILVGAAGVSVIAIGGYLAGSGGGGDVTASDDAGSGSSQELAGEQPGSGAAQETVDPMEAPGPDGESDDDVTMNQQDTGLTERVRTVAASGTEVDPNCGAAFASSIDATLVGSQEIDDGILVVTTVDGTSTLEGWTLDSCDTSTPDADAEPVIVPRP